MTTMAAMLGGSAAGYWEPAPAPSCDGRWGITIIGGLIVSQILTLLYDSGGVSLLRPASSLVGEGMRKTAASKNITSPEDRSS